MTLTSHERILRVFENKPYDRPVLKLWGANPGQTLLHPDYKCVSERAAAVTDIFSSQGSDISIYAGKNTESFIRYEDHRTCDPLWIDRITTITTPLGDLRSVDKINAIGDPDYTVEHMIKEPDDLRKLLSLPYDAATVDLQAYEAERDRIGDRGIVMYGLDNPIYALGRMTGSENLALFAYDCRELVSEAIQIFSGRIYNHVRQVLNQTRPPVFSWVGPEICIPPLMAPRDFEEFVFAAEKPYCDAIHDAGSHIWLHCHGKVAKYIDRFIAMGIDVLNPLEPPKNGDVSLHEVVALHKNSIGLEGNIEIQDLLDSDAQTVRALIRQCVDEGSASGRFILCPSAGFMEYALPKRRYIENLMTYIDYGLECVERHRN